MKTRITLYAEDGMILTDGEHFGKVIHLAAGASTNAYREITEAEYEAMLAAEGAAARGGETV